jgi:hypothetical protein
MGLSIKNTEVERMVREIATTRGVSMTEALRQVLAEEVARQRAAREAEIEAPRRRWLSPGRLRQCPTSAT